MKAKFFLGAILSLISSAQTVSATRPTHLLCIAARKEHFTEKDIALIEDSGMWKVTILSGE